MDNYYPHPKPIVFLSSHRLRALGGYTRGNGVARGSARTPLVLTSLLPFLFSDKKGRPKRPATQGNDNMVCNDIMHHVER